MRMARPRRAGHNGQRAGLNRLKGSRHFSHTGTAADDHNGRRTGLHDSPRRLKAIHLGHMNVHGDHVGLRLLSSFETFLAIRRNSHHPNPWVSIEHVR